MDCKYLSGTERKKEHARTEQTRKMFMDMNRAVYISSVRLAEWLGLPMNGQFPTEKKIKRK